MIRYELKDKERQAALEKALPGFEEALQNDCKDQFSDPTDFVNVAIGQGKGWGYECLVGIQKNAILVKETYDPYKWNNYPEVTPPYGVLLRCEGGYLGSDRKFHDAMTYRPDCFFREDNGLPMAHDKRVERFRPWDEEAAK